MTAKVLPFARRDARPVNDPPADPPEYSAALSLLAARGAFASLLVVRFVLVLALPAILARVEDGAARRRIRARLEVAERGITRAVRMLVTGARR